MTARRLYAAGTLPVPTYRLGRLIMVGEPLVGGRDAGEVVVYAPVSSADQSAGLDRQVARVRFACFGGEYVGAALVAQGRRLLVVDSAEVDDDLVGDVTEILTSPCARLYGRRAAANRARRAVEAIEAGVS